MTAPFIYVDAARHGQDRALSHEPSEFLDLLGPVMAGARARGVADAFELLGMAAVLIDGTGRVLHAGARAREALAPLVDLVEHHLLAAEPEAAGPLQALISDVIAPGPLDRSVVDLRSADRTRAVRLRAVRIPCRELEPAQLLHAVLFAEPLS